jgi:CRISPR-associated protein Cas1
MIKRTIHLGNPAYLATRQEQLMIQYPEKESKDPFVVPIEDIGLLVIEHQQITITNSLLAKLLSNNVAVIICDDTHMPTGLFYNLDGNSLQSQKHQAQVSASTPLKKQLWQQTVSAKIRNQASLLKMSGQNSGILETMANKVSSGDSGNFEAKAASYYWKRIFPEFLEFTRDRLGAPPNNLLNYGYAILRAVTARALTGSGLLPTLGIHHRNQYNAYCLADDIMEPYRPFVDRVVCHIVDLNGKFLDMTTAMKKELLGIPALDVELDGKKSPLMNAMSRTTASLAQCFEGVQRKILYPALN